MSHAPRRTLGAALVVAALVAGILLVLRPGAGGDAASAPDGGGLRDPGLAPPPTGFAIGKPIPLAPGRDESRWAPVRTAVVARAAPRAGARAVVRLSTRTPEDTSNLVLALSRVRGADGALWVRVRLPVLPNNRTGWVPRSALGGYGLVNTRLVVDRRRLRATLLREGRPVFRARVGIGTADAPTPSGEFYIRNKLDKFSSATYGPLAFGTSARSATLTDWPDGGFVGIHGTDRPDILPGRVSHGCIRLANRDILRLARAMPVGTPLTIL